MDIILEQFVKKRLSLGFKIGDVSMTHLAQSNSQIKEKSFWFIADMHESKSALIAKFGEFTEPNIMKNMARIG